MAKKDEAQLEEDLDEGSDPRVYELGFHLDPELPSEEVKKAYTLVKGEVEKAGTVVAEGEPQRVQLAYTISRQEVGGRRDFDSAYFAWIAYESLPTKHAELLSSVKGNGSIVRFIDLVTSKDAARNSVELHELANAMNAQGSAPEEEEAQAELDAAIEQVTV